MREPILLITLQAMKLYRVQVRAAANRPAFGRAVAMVCALVLLFLPTAPTDAKPLPEHNLTVRIGSGPLKNILVLVWDHRNPACAAAYRQVVMALSPEIDSGKLTVLLMQVLPQGTMQDDAEVANGVALSMLPPSSYGAMVTEWLETLPEGQTLSTAEIGKRVADALFKHWSRDPNFLAAQLKNASEYTWATTKLKTMAELIAKDLPWPDRRTPLLLLNGVTAEQYGVRTFTADEIRKRLLPF